MEWELKADEIPVSVKTYYYRLWVKKKWTHFIIS